MIAIIILIALVILGIFYITRKETFGSQSGGALIQLAAKDIQDSYLIGRPRPYYSSFSSYYYPYSYSFFYPDYPYVV